MVRAAFNFLKWFFRSQLLVAAISSYVFFISFGEVRDAFSSNGPYLVPGPEYSDEILYVSRQEYIRHEASNGIFMALMALMFWGLAAHSLKEAEEKNNKDIDYLKWKLAEYEKNFS